MQTFSKKITITVGLFYLIQFLTLFIFLVLAIARHYKHRVEIIRGKVKKETKEAEVELHSTFGSLHQGVEEKIKKYEETRIKRPLSEEEKIVEQLKRDLDIAESRVQKEIKDIEEI